MLNSPEQVLGDMHTVKLFARVRRTWCVFGRRTGPAAVVFIDSKPRHATLFRFGSMSSLTFGLTLVRHGETQYNKDGLLQGQAIDSRLSEIGQQQAEAAGQYLKDVKFSDVFVSDMLRAKQTAEAIMQRNSSCLSLQMVCDPLLKERSFGFMEGKPVQDLRDMAKAAGQSMPGFTPPQGETQEQVKERVKEFLVKMLQQLWDQYGGADRTLTSAPAEVSPAEGKADDGVRALPVHAMVVSHGAYIRVAIHHFVEDLDCALPQGCDKAHMLSLSPNTGLCRFILTLAEVPGGFKLSEMRCVFVHRGDHIRQ